MTANKPNANDIANSIDWDNYGDMAQRYSHWVAIAGYNADLSYEFSTIGAFYDPQGDCYYIAHTSGCSCHCPWDESSTDISGPHNKNDAIRAYRGQCNNGYMLDNSTDIQNATQQIRDHTPTPAP